MKNTYQLILSILSFFLFLSSTVKAQKIIILQQGKSTSIRGLSVVNDKIAWVSGSNGYVAITNDSGKTWAWQQIKGYEKSEFRDIEAFSNKEAVIMSSGTPSLILKTTDGGKSWQQKFIKADSSYFLDAMGFVDKQHGYILGDPINNKFLLLETRNGGETWDEIKNSPKAHPGEAAFAASGTCLEIDDHGVISIVTGGKVSRLITKQGDNGEWKYDNLDMAHGKSSQGAFSIACGVIVGGDYANDKKTDSVITIYTNHPYAHFYSPKSGPAGYQSCVTYVESKKILSTGTSGSNISFDGCSTWQQIDTTSFNVCGKAKRGKLILLAGDKGKIGILEM
ncbi:WD40/YVTN/BNR-like repeat-containing protein [Mucilaginibacter sp. SP1R1]|uniref:WD40/YVTN/BNR-like repeat-containing protein n=1 Tax=Mucilaginibacter sp. SP1R1 TaxID=2723091 RepID=UPI00161C56D6|nr:YCF48-related protein [Mucilaginibacter sp. SP1R1]MBB6149579.1 photosystem II stability/assembly factor-like uncharacterized protein [Mucilaginibacter sp. SP1R1]